MERSMDTIKILFIIVVMSVSVSMVAAEEPEPQITVEQGEEIWAHSGQETELMGSYQCEDNSDVSVGIDAPEIDPSGLEVEDGEFYRDFDVNNLKEDYGLGTYTVKLDCNSDDSVDAEDSFEVKYFSIERTEPEEDITVFKDSGFSYSVKGYVNGEEVSLDNYNPEFFAESLDGDSFNANQIGSDGNEMIVDVDIPEDIESGEWSIVTPVGIDRGDGIIQEADQGPIQVQVEPTWGVQVLNTTPDDRQLPYQNINEMALSVEITENGEPYERLGSSNFFVEIEDQMDDSGSHEVEGIIESESHGDGEYLLYLSAVPDLDLGRYDFSIGLDKNDEIISNFTVSKYILFEGTIRDSTGQTVNGRISYDTDGFQREVNVEGGEYSGNVLPGSYNFSLEFPEAELSLQEVMFEESEEGVSDGEAVGDIRYDEIPVGEVSDSLEGITVVNSVAVWFGYPFEEGRMSMSYDTSNMDPSEVRVYECVGWSMEGLNCFDSTGWDEVNMSRSNVHPTVGEVNFPVSRYNDTGSPMLLNAYMVVKNSPLQLDSVNIGSDRVERGGELSVDGSIEAGGGDAVDGVEVEVKVVDMEGEQIGSSEQVVTNSHGAFGSTVTVPDEEGTYRIQIQADKTPYDSLETTLDAQFDVFTERSISIDAPSTEEFPVGERSESQYTITNTGQEVIEDVQLSFRGFERDTWNFQRDNWPELQPGESVSTTLVTQVPDDFCEESCQEYRTVEIEVTGDSSGRVNDMESLEAQITKQQEEQQTSETETETSSLDLSSSVERPDVGSFLEEQSNFNIALGILMVFVLVLAAAVKNRDQDDRGDRNMVPGGSPRGGNGRSGGASPQLGPVDNGSDVIDVEASDNADDIDNNNGAKSSSDSVQDSTDLPEKQTEQDSESKNSESSITASSSSVSKGDGLNCSVCGEEFDTKTALDIHENSVH